MGRCQWEEWKTGGILDMSLSHMGFPGGSAGKEPACNVGDLGSIPGLGRSPGGGNPTPVFWPGELHGLCSPSGCRESTGWSDFHFHCHKYLK